jgi:hypothetical protein
MRKARDEFHTPAGLKVIVACPELQDRDLLKMSNSHRTAKGGVMSQCPKCKSNRFMRLRSWTASRTQCQKSLSKEMTHDIIVGALFGCCSVDCCTCNETTKRKTPKSFTSHAGDLWKQHPQNVRGRHLEFVSRVEDRSTSLVISPGLCDRLLSCHGSFADFATELIDARDQRFCAASSSHASFLAD